MIAHQPFFVYFKQTTSFSEVLNINQHTDFQKIGFAICEGDSKMCLVIGEKRKKIRLKTFTRLCIMKMIVLCYR